jgi:hypothetical protein
MNLHKSAESIRRRYRVLPANIERVDFDRMPYEVATEMLADPRARMTNRERKECMRARETRYQSTRTAKPVAGKLENRFDSASFAQLSRWNRRAVNRRRDAQCAYQLLARQLDKVARTESPAEILKVAAAMAKRRQLELDLAVMHFDTIIELTGAEIKLRCADRSLSATL